MSTLFFINRFFTSEEDDGTTQNLVIRNASKQHEGTYKCIAENTEGVATSTGYLSVTGAN